MNTVFIDVDGVLLDWIGAFLDWAYENNITHDKNGDPLRVKPEWVTEYNLPTAMMHWMHPDDVRPAVRRFEGSRQWHEMRPLADIRLLEAVKNAGVRLHILSACTQEHRVDSLLRLTRHYGPVFDGCTFCEQHEKAGIIECAIAEAALYDMWLIEDCPRNLMPAHYVNNLLVSQPYNLTGPDANAVEELMPNCRCASVNEALLRVLKEVLNAQ